MNHLEGILNYCRTKVPLVMMEAINGDIKSLLRRGRGYSNLRYLLLKAQRLAATRTELWLSGKQLEMPVLSDSGAEPYSLSMQLHKTVIKYAFSRLGYQMRRTQSLGSDPFADMSRFVESRTPVLFDVGANVGQTIRNFRQHFKQSTIHSFEPSPSTFQTLRERTLGIHRASFNERWLGRPS